MEQMRRKTDTIELQKQMIGNGYPTIQSLSRASGINRNTLGDIVKGRAQPTYDVMLKLIEFLNLSEIDAGRIFFAPDLRDA